MRPVRCLVCSQLVTAAVLAGRPSFSLVARHEVHCLRCQAHRASLRITRRTLGSFGAVKERPPAVIAQGVLGSIVASHPAALGPSGSDRPWWPAAAGVAFAALAAWGWRRSQAGKA